MLVTDVTPLQDTNELIHVDNRPFTDVWPVTINQKSDATRNRTIKKKRKRVRTAFTTEQLRALEKSFLQNKYINSENRWQLSNELNIAEKSVKIWFQNRRMKEKRSSSESSDSTSEVGREVPSPPLMRPEIETENGQIGQYTHNSVYNYYPAYNVYNIDESQAQFISQQTVATNNGVINGVAFCNESPYPTHYYPSGETEGVQENVYQNQFQYGNDMYNYWCNNTFNNYY